MNMRGYNVANIRGLLTLMLIWPASVALAQQQGSIFGRIVDAKTKQPVPFATVFLANTSIGANSDAEGNYRIEKVPSGKYDITISSLGYQPRQISVVVQGDSREIRIELSEDVKTLREVTITRSRADPARWMTEFRVYFIGLTPNTKECTIMNPDVLDFDYDESGRVLNVTASSPVVVENKALGYRIHYLLQQFTIDYQERRFLMVGIPRFEELTPRGESQRKRWEHQRELTYHGSLTHFMRSLKARQLEENRFEVFTLCGKNRVRARMDSLFSGDSRSLLISSCPLEIQYRGETLRQVSQLKLLEGRLTIYENGNYSDQFQLVMGGYFGKNEKIMAEMLPMDYRPADAKK